MVIASYFFGYETFVVFIKSDTLDNTINLGALREEINSAFFVEDSLDALRDAQIESISVYK